MIYYIQMGDNTMDEQKKKQEKKISLLEKKGKLEKARKKLLDKLESVNRELAGLNDDICQIDGHSFKEYSPILTKMGFCTTRRCEVCGKVIKEYSNKNEDQKRVLKQTI